VANGKQLDEMVVAALEYTFTEDANIETPGDDEFDAVT
jgi:hypothetical protein